MTVTIDPPTDVLPVQPALPPAQRGRSVLTVVVVTVGGLAGLAVGLALDVWLMWSLTLLLGSPGAAVAGVVLSFAGLCVLAWSLLRG
ncbi:hypothetical protein [Nocardia abscessus]|uniref:hypothetical protein n=1 Tax=Nocardia abscessus TaxID=120957 RepID=UPI0024572ED0|nr:hypothetical protein [Nocardia abscessus]